MDFWGTEIKKGLTEIVKIPYGSALHLTTACLGPYPLIIMLAIAKQKT